MRIEYYFDRILFPIFFFFFLHILVYFLPSGLALTFKTVVTVKPVFFCCAQLSKNSLINCHFSVVFFFFRKTSDLFMIKLGVISVYLSLLLNLQQHALVAVHNYFMFL